MPPPDMQKVAGAEEPEEKRPNGFTQAPQFQEPDPESFLDSFGF